MCTGEVDRKVWMRLRLRRLDRLGAAVDVLGRGAGEPADHRVLGARRDLLDGGEIALRGDRKAGLDDVDAHVVEQLGDLELLLMGHGGARALLAVAQGGVEDDDAVLARTSLAWSWKKVLLALRPLPGALGFLVIGEPPECPGASAQPALRGG